MKVKASPQFVADFEAVAAHYDLRELGEYEAARNAARADLDAAITTYRSLAQELLK